MPTASEINELRAKLAALESENAELRAQAVLVANAEEAEASTPARHRRPGLWRGIVSAICIVLASILVVVATVGTWARAELVDEQAFVSTFGPLAEDPDVQALVIDRASTLIIESLDVDQLTSDLFDGIQTLDLPPRATAAIALLRGPAAEGVKSLIGTGVTTAVESDAFPRVWQGALVASHRALVAVATNDSSGAIAIGDAGEIGIQLGPIIEEVKAQLIANGFAFASSIPAIDATIVVAQAEALTMVSSIYALAISIGWWLPIIALVLFAAGIGVARSRRTAVIGTALGIAIAGFLLAAVFAIGGQAAGLAAPSLGIPAAAINAVYTQVIAAMADTAVLIGIIGLIVLFFAWVTGPSRPAVVVRRITTDVNGSLRTWLAARGMRTGRFGLVLAQYAPAIQIAIAVLAALVLFLLRPFTIGTIVGVGIVALLLWWATEVFQPPAVATAAEAEPVDEVVLPN